MAETVTVIYWRDIPAQVVAGKGRHAARIMLADRFQEAIDRAATRAGLIGSDEYMAQWRKVEVDGDVDTVAGGFEADFSDEMLNELVRNYGEGP